MHPGPGHFAASLSSAAPSAAPVSVTNGHLPLTELTDDEAMMKETGEFQQDAKLWGGG